MNSQIKEHIEWGLRTFLLQKLLSLWSWGTSTLPVLMCSYLEALQTPYYWDFMEVFSHWYDQLLTPFLAPHPFLEDERRAKNSELLIVAWFFWWPIRSHPVTPAPQTPLIRTKDVPCALINLRTYKDLEDPSQELRIGVYFFLLSHADYPYLILAN